MSSHTPAEVFPPGDFVKEELGERGWTQSDFASILGRPIQAVNEIIAGKRSITADTARAIGEAFGTGPEIWMNLESAWRLSRLKELDDRVARRAKLYGRAPVNEILKRRWIEKTDDYDELERQIVRFMGMQSVDDTPSFCAAARKSSTYGEETPSQVAWLRRARQLAQCVETKRFKKKSFADDVQSIRDLAASEADARRISTFLSEFGVRFVVVAHLSRNEMDGATFWLDDKSPVIAISIRFDRIDHMWHTLTHEIAHVANGDGKCYVDHNLVGESSQSTAEKPEIERKADEFASNLLIPKEQLGSFIARVGPLYSKKQIIGFANRVGIHPGIVVGQLQHCGEIGYWHSRPLLVKVRHQLQDSVMIDGWGNHPELSATE